MAEEVAEGVQTHEADARISTQGCWRKASAKGMFGTKMRSVIKRG